MKKTILPIALLSASAVCLGASYSVKPMQVFAEGETSEVVAEPQKEFDWQEWLGQWLSPQTITAIVSILGALGAVLKMAASIKELHKKDQLTIHNVTEAVKKELPDDVKEVVEPYLDKISKSEEQIVKIMEVFSKVLALSQENTPEAKIAILNAIQELGMVQKEVTEKAKQVIEQKVEEEKQKEEIQKQIVTDVADKTSAYDGTSI